MNSLWPPLSRFSCRQPHSLLSSCYKADRLIHVQIRRTCISACNDDTGKLIPGVGRLKAPQSSKRSILEYSRRQPQSLFSSRSFVPKRIITKFEDLTQSYKDRDGLPFAIELLSPNDVYAIFGKNIDPPSANRLIAILHGRRVAGTLADMEIFSNANPYEQHCIQVGLAWLRENVPVDEIRSAGMHAERELLAMEEEVARHEEKLGFYKPTTPAHGGDINGGVYGKGVLDALREYNSRSHTKQEQTPKTQADEIRQNTGTLVTAPRSSIELQDNCQNPRLKYYIDRSKILPDKPPEMTMFQRLWPSAFVVFGAMLGCILFAQAYRPPKRIDRLMPDIPPAAATIVGILLINLTIFALWHHPPAFRMLNKYFITTPGYPYALSLVGNIFSHQNISHLTVNMAMLYFVGTRLHDEIGRGNFIAVYLGCGIIGSFTSLTSWVVRGSFISSSLGASGAVAGIIATYLWLNCNATVKILGSFSPDAWPTIPSFAFLTFLIAVECYGLSRWNRSRSNFDHWAHLGGYGSGVVAAELLKMKTRKLSRLNSNS